MVGAGFVFDKIGLGVRGGAENAGHRLITIQIEH